LTAVLKETKLNLVSGTDLTEAEKDFFALREQMTFSVSVSAFFIFHDKMNHFLSQTKRIFYERNLAMASTLLSL
jgi:hypothetical protein